MAVTHRAAIGHLANPTLDFTDYSVYSSLSDEELVQIAVERSLAELEHPPQPVQNRPPQPVQNRPPQPVQNRPPPPTYNLPPATPIPAHTPSRSPVHARLKQELGPLQLLIEQGDLQALRGRIRSDPDSAMEADSEGWIALHEAAYFGQLQCLQVLLEAHPATLNKVIKTGHTALLLAVGEEHVSCVEYLLQHGADPNLSNKDGESPLFRGCEKPNEQIVSLLLTFGALVNKCCNQGGTPFHEAARTGVVKICEILLEAGANVDASNKYGIMPFFLAALSGSVDVVDFLIRKGVDPNVQVNDGATALYEACKNGQETTVEMLLSHKASANISTKSGLLPIHVAGQKGHTSIVSLLIPVTRMTRVQISGLSPLHIAAECNTDDILEILIEAGYDVNAELSSDRSKMYEDRRCTALYFSVFNLNYEAVEMLLEAGANPNVDAFNPLLIAVRKGCVDMVTLLLQHGANVNASISTHPSRFPSAALLAMPSLPMLKVLLDNGCDARACFDCVYGSQAHPPIASSRHRRAELRYRAGEQPQGPLQFCEAISDPSVCSWAAPIISVLLDYVAHVKLCSRLREHLDAHRDGAAINVRATLPHPLMQLCRLKIRRSVGVQRLKLMNNLLLPPRLVQFLNYDVQNTLNDDI